MTANVKVFLFQHSQQGLSQNCIQYLLSWRVVGSCVTAIQNSSISKLEYKISSLTLSSRNQKKIAPLIRPEQGCYFPKSVFYFRVRLETLWLFVKLNRSPCCEFFDYDKLSLYKTASSYICISFLFTQRNSVNFSREDRLSASEALSGTRAYLNYNTPQVYRASKAIADWARVVVNPNRGIHTSCRIGFSVPVGFEPDPGWNPRIRNYLH